jgi:prepilin-type N-terminal cleavage/methylation domain-containing protein/prepilin-type processing-associated H-X9-DG protein
MKRQGLTLMELLVVILLIALLMGILLPFLIGSRKYARRVLCSFNIKQSVYGLCMYETNYKNLPHSFDNTLTVPPPGGYPGNSRYDILGWWWFNYIGDYFPQDKRDKLFLCPSRSISTILLVDNILYGNYGVNQSLCRRSGRSLFEPGFRGAPLNRSDISSPEQTLMIVDCGYAMIKWHHAADKPPVKLRNMRGYDTAYIPGLKINEQRQLLPGQEQDAVEGRHIGKTVNAGFADGHISRTDANDFLVTRIKKDTYRNLSPLWVPKK